MKYTINFEYKKNCRKFKYYAHTTVNDEPLSARGVNFEDAQAKLTDIIKNRQTPLPIEIEI